MQKDRIRLTEIPEIIGFGLGGSLVRFFHAPFNAEALEISIFLIDFFFKLFTWFLHRFSNSV